MPVTKLDVVESVALNVPGYAAPFFKFYFILFGISFVVLAYRGSVVVYTIKLKFYRMSSTIKQLH